MGAITIDELQIEISARSKKADSAIDALIDRLEKLEKGLMGVTSANNKTSASFNGTTQKITQTTKTITNVSKGTQGASSAIALLGKKFAVLAGGAFSLSAALNVLRKTFDGIYNSTLKYSDLVESINFENVAVEKISEAWKRQFSIYGYESAAAYADSFYERLNETLGNLSGMKYDLETGLILSTGEKSLGASMDAVVKFQAQLLSLTNSLGLTGEASFQTANAFSYLAADIASLNGLNFDDVAQKLRSGLLGSSEVLYSLGIDATDSALAITALNHGIEKSVSEMTQAEKVQLRFLTVLEASSIAYSDQANTVNSLSNMLKLFESTTADISVLIGQIFAPLLAKTLPIVNGFALALKDLLSNVAKILNINVPESGTAFEGLGDGLSVLEDGFAGTDKAASKLRKTLLGFDKLNVISTTDTASSVWGGYTGLDLTQQIIQASERYTNIAKEAFDNMTSFAQNASDEIEDSFANIGRGLLKSFKVNIPQFLDNLESLKESILEIGTDENVVSNAESFKKNFEDLIGSFWGFESSALYSVIGGEVGGLASAVSQETDYIKDKTGKIFANSSEVASNLSTFFEGLSTVATVFESEGFVKIIEFISRLNIVVQYGVLEKASRFFKDMTKLFTKPFTDNAGNFRDIFAKIFEIASNLLSPLSLITDKLALKFSEDSMFGAFINSITEVSSVLLTNTLNGLLEILEVIENITSVIPAVVDILRDWNGFGFETDFNFKPINLTGSPLSPTYTTPPENGLFMSSATNSMNKFESAKYNTSASGSSIAENVEEAAYRGMSRALATQTNQTNVNISLEGDASRMFRVIRKEADEYLRRTGRPVF